MMTIILSACLIANPTECKDFRIPLNVSELMSTNQCAIFAPPYFAQWAQENPAWEVRKWRCQAGSVEDI